MPYVVQAAAGLDGGCGEMSQAMQWLMQPQSADVPKVNLSWADASAWRFGAPPRDTSAAKTTKKAAPAARAKKAKTTSRCSGPDDEEHFPSHKPGVLSFVVTWGFRMYHRTMRPRKGSS